MTDSALLKRLLDAGMQFTEMSQKKAEKIVNDFVKAGEVRRKDAEKPVSISSSAAEPRPSTSSALIQAEVSKQLGRFADRLDDVEARVEEVAGNLGLASKAPAKKAPAQAAGPSGVAKVAARKAPAKKAPAKKAAAKKAPAKKAPAKKAPAKKAAAKKAPAKKAAAKKALRSSSPCRGASGSTPRWCAVGWCSAGPRRRARSRPGWSWSTARSPTRPRRLVDPGDAVVLQGPPSRFVSRGGEKLDAALDAFGVDVTGLRVLDAGASTGGFTDCLLQRGAAHVVALDVGHGQLHPRSATTSGSRCSSGSTSATRPPTRSAARSTSWWPTCRSSRSSGVLPSLLAVCRPGGDAGAAREAAVRGRRQRSTAAAA